MCTALWTAPIAAANVGLKPIILIPPLTAVGPASAKYQPFSLKKTNTLDASRGDILMPAIERIGQALKVLEQKL